MQDVSTEHKTPGDYRAGRKLLGQGGTHDPRTEFNKSLMSQERPEAEFVFHKMIQEGNSRRFSRQS